MASISMDTSELRALAADMTQAASSIDGKVLPIIEHGAVNIKARLRAEMGSSRSFKGIVPSIGYDMHSGQMFGVGVIEAEIGPKSGPGDPGNLANIAYFGSSRGGGTVPDPQGALDAEAPNVEKYLGDLIGDL